MSALPLICGSSLVAYFACVSCLLVLVGRGVPKLKMQSEPAECQAEVHQMSDAEEDVIDVDHPRMAHVEQGVVVEAAGPSIPDEVLSGAWTKGIQAQYGVNLKRFHEVRP